jgi:hypothetical protein
VAQTLAPETPAPVSKGLSLPARIIGVLTAPRATYADVAARPRWLGALLFVAIIGSASVFTFLSTEIGQQAALEQQRTTMESFGMRLNDAQVARMEQGVKYAPYTGGIGQLVFWPIAGAIIAGIALGIFNALLGGDATFKQVFAIVAHSGVVMTLAQLFGLPLAYVRESMVGTTNLAVLLPFLDETTFVARLLGGIDLFVVWWLVSLSIGLGVLFRRRTAPIAVSLLIVYGTIALIIAAIKTAAAGA